MYESLYHYKVIYSMINSPRSWRWRLICLTVSDVKIVEKGIIKSLKAKKRIKKERMNYHPVDMKVGCWYLWINPLILWTHTLLYAVFVFVFLSNQQAKQNFMFVWKHQNIFFVNFKSIHMTFLSYFPQKYNAIMYESLDGISVSWEYH